MIHLVTPGKTITISVPKMAQLIVPRRHPRVALEVAKDAPDRFILEQSYHSSRCATSGRIDRSADDAKKERLRRQEFNI